MLYVRVLLLLCLLLHTMVLDCNQAEPLILLLCLPLRERMSLQL